VSGEKQPDAQMQTDGQGRFAFNKVCAGSIRLFARAPDGRQLFGQATVKAGDTNITLQLARPRVGGGGPREVFQPVSLKGKPLPDLTSIGVRAAEAPTDQPVLAVFVDEVGAQKSEPSSCHDSSPRLDFASPKPLLGGNSAPLLLEPRLLANHTSATSKRQTAITFNEAPEPLLWQDGAHEPD